VKYIGKLKTNLRRPALDIAAALKREVNTTFDVVRGAGRRYTSARGIAIGSVWRGIK